jgi:CheY-like chemotaxis protein
MLMRRLLKQHAPAAVIHEAADGFVACDMMAAAKQAGAPLFSRGVICMDKEMPRCDGYTATQRIHGIGFHGRILGITGNAIAEDIAAFLACGADVVLTKPLSFPVFLGHLRSFAGDTDLSTPSGC